MKTKTKSRSQSLHFTIQGEHFTWLLRHLWIEENEVKALRMWNSAFPELGTIEKINSFFLPLVSGKKKFVGENEFTLVDDNAKFWDSNRDGKPNESFPLLQSWEDVIKLKELRLFITELRLRNFRLRRRYPELYVNDSKIWMFSVDENRIENRFREKVNKYYVEVKNLTRQFLSDIDNILPMLCNEMPLSTGPTFKNKKDYKTYEQQKEAYKNILVYLVPIKKYFDKKYGGKIHTYSDSEIRKFFGFKEIEEGERAFEIENMPEVINAKVNKKVILGTPDVETFLKNLRKESERNQIKPEDVNTTEWTSGYIDRKGKFYGCTDIMHRSFAEEICEQFGFKVDDDKEDVQILLDKKGWVKVSMNRFYWDYRNVRVNKEQKRTIFDYMLAKKIDKTDIGEVYCRKTFNETFKEDDDE
jgi:hypothetical protein